MLRLLAPTLTRRGAAAARSLTTSTPAAKETTGIVGLDVDSNARASLEAALQSVQAALAAHVPAGAEYRRSLEALCGEWCVERWGRGAERWEEAGDEERRVCLLACVRVCGRAWRLRRGRRSAKSGAPSIPRKRPHHPTHSLAAVRSPASDADLETAFGFQLEALTKQLGDELDLIPKMREWAPWDVPEGETRELRIERPVPPPEPKK